MADTTPRRGIRFPEGGDQPDVPQDIENLATDLDDAPIDAQGVHASRGVATMGRWYTSTDTPEGKRVFRGNGSTFDELATVPINASHLDGGDLEPAYVWARRTTQQYPANGTDTALSFSGVYEEVGGDLWALANPTRLVATKTGLWDATAFVVWDAGGLPDYRRLRIRWVDVSAGVTRYVAHDSGTFDATGGAIMQQATALAIPMDEGDYIEAVANQSGGIGTTPATDTDRLGCSAKLVWRGPAVVFRSA